VQTRELVRAHVRALREVPCLANANVVMLLEANLPSEAQLLGREFVRWAGVTVPSCGAREYGVWTTNEIKTMCALRLGDKLAAGALRYHAPFVAANPFTRPSENAAGTARATEARRELERQLRSFQRIALLPRSLHGAVRHVLTGKADKDHQQSARMKDDLCLALLLAVYWSGQHRENLLRGPPRTYGSRLLLSSDEMRDGGDVGQKRSRADAADGRRRAKRARNDGGGGAPPPL